MGGRSPQNSSEPQQERTPMRASEPPLSKKPKEFSVPLTVRSPCSKSEKMRLDDIVSIDLEARRAVLKDGRTGYITKMYGVSGTEVTDTRMAQGILIETPAGSDHINVNLQVFGYERERR